MASTRRSRTHSNSRASSAIAPIISGAGSSASTNEMTSHSVFAHPRAAGQHLESCPQCSPETEGLHHILPTLTSSRSSPRRSSSLSTDLINNDPSTVIVGCQECHRNSQRSNSRNRRTRRSSPATTSTRITSTPEPLEASASASAAQDPAHPNSRRSRSSRSSRNRSRQRRQRRRQRRANSTTEGGNAGLTGSVAATQTIMTNNDNQMAAFGPVTPEQEAAKSQIRQWPHNLSFLFACLTCTVGMFSISRFAILTIDLGVTFILQFLLLSIIFGIPLFAFHISLGQYLGSGVVDVWRISPIHQGIGIALMISQGLYGLYNIAAVSWLFVFFKDSFITAFDKYKWSMCYSKYEGSCALDKQVYNNSWKLEQTIPDYYNGQVLLRSSPTYPQSFSGELRFQTLFHIVVIWMSVFIGLSKGLKSYGKVVYLFAICPLVGYIVFTIKVIGLLPLETFQYWIKSTNWLNFFYNGDSWICAARECFFTWCILGATISQLASHNKFKHKLFRDSAIVILITFTVLVLSGICGIAIVDILHQYGYEYEASSFETSESYKFLSKIHWTKSYNSPMIDQRYANYYIQNGDSNSNNEHISFLAGVRIIRDDRHPDKYSGYQVMRLATELVPALASLLTPKAFSPFWVVMFYLSMIVFGLGQHMALFNTISSGLIAIRPEHFLQFESSLIFMSCLLGLVFCFPIATEFGAFVVYFFDYTIGSGWWMMVLYVLQLCAIFVIRGKPYSGEQVATALITKAHCCSSALIPLLAFSWHVISPVGLIILSVVSFRWCRFSEMFDWTTHSGYLYLPAWVREIGAMMQLLPLLLVPFVAVIQSCRYFLNGHGPLHERINLLYRPTFEAHVSHSDRSRSNHRRRNRRGNDTGVVLTNYNAGDRFSGPEDPPPKYTPPPSYSTATGARIARFLRQSFRQSIRRFRGESVDSPQPGVQSNANLRGRQARGKLNPEFAAPPDYATVIIETTRHSGTTQNTNSEYGSFNASQDRATPSIVSSELTLLESPSSEMLNQAQATTSFNNENELKTNSIPSQRYSNLLDAEDNGQEEITVTVTNAEPIDSVQGASALITNTKINFGAISTSGSGGWPTSGSSLNADPEDNLYSIPASTSATEADKAYSEYTLVKDVKVELPAASLPVGSFPAASLPVASTSMANVKNNKMSDSELEIYSAASTLSLGETVILSDGWLNLNHNNTGANIRETTNSLSSNSLTTDYSQSVVQSAPNISPQNAMINSEISDQDLNSSQSTIVLTLDVDTSASVI